MEFILNPLLLKIEVKMKNKSQSLLALALVLFTTLGCSFINQVKKEVEKSQTPKDVFATDNSCKITVPGNWQSRTDLQEDAILQVANTFSEQYAVVISESKSDFSEDTTLTDYAGLLKSATKQNVSDITFSEIKNIQINGLPAVQYEAEGTVDKIKIKWIFNLLDGGKTYHQLVLWTLPSKYEQNKPVFDNVINSFKDLSDSGATVSPKNSNISIKIK